MYVVIAKSTENTKLYVGKTGDNNDGCNPLISRCGNHFDSVRRECIDRINEMERWLNEEIQAVLKGKESIQLLNPYSGTGRLRKAEREKRGAFRNIQNSKKIESLVMAVLKELDNHVPSRAD